MVAEGADAVRVTGDGGTVLGTASMDAVRKAGAA